jgi:hypothetical protein
MSKDQLRVCSSSLSSILEEASSNILRNRDYNITNGVNNACLLLLTLRETVPDLFRDTVDRLGAPLFVLSSLYPHLSLPAFPGPGVSKLLAKILQDGKPPVLNAIIPDLRAWITDLDVRAR